MLILPGNHLERLNMINTLNHKLGKMHNTWQGGKCLIQCENMWPGNCFPNTENHKQLSSVLPDYTHHSVSVTLELIPCFISQLCDFWIITLDLCFALPSPCLMCTASASPVHLKGQSRLQMESGTRDNWGEELHLAILIRRGLTGYPGGPKAAWAEFQGRVPASANFLGMDWGFLSGALLGVNRWTLGCEELPEYGGACTGL